MNLILGKSKQEHAGVSWEPFATSTPLKVVPNNGKIFHELKLLTQIGSVNYFGNSVKDPCTSDIFQGKLTQSKDSITKKGKRNKSSTYFDSSSSDDEDPAVGRRPIIKINTSRKTRCLIKTKKVESEESVNKISEPVDSSLKLKSVESKENSVPANVNLKSEKGHTQNGKKKTEIANNKSNSIISSLNSDESSKIFDESKNNNFITDIKSSSTLNSKRNESNHSKSKLKHNDAKSCKKSKAKEMPKILIKQKSKVSDSSPQNKADNNKVSKTLKRSTNNVISNIPVKKSLNKNTKSKLSTQRNKCEATPLHIWENKRNLSHQLFSDSREKEFINTLDLTSEEINEAVENEKHSLWQKQKEIPHKQITLSHQRNENGDNICKPDEDKQERPKRRKQKPKEFWIPESESDKSSNIVKVDKKKHQKKNSKISKKTELNSVQKPLTELNDRPELSEDVKENNPENAVKTNMLSPKPLKRGRRKKGKAQENEKPNEHNDAVVSSSNDGKIKPAETNSVFNCSRTNAPTNGDLESSNITVKNTTVEERTTTADLTVFKQLNKLPFSDNGMGCFATQCWHTNNFKCGVFKLLVNSHLSCKTQHSNSHLGGVVVKGILKMKIGDRVLDLKEGDMAFVPPKTEWQATNIGECESIFYYWCGRFNC